MGIKSAKIDDGSGLEIVGGKVFVRLLALLVLHGTSLRHIFVELVVLLNAPLARFTELHRV